MVRKNRLTARIRYAFDNIMSRGTIALIGWLAFFTVILVFIMSVAVHLLNAAPEGYNFINIVWMSLMRTFDAGNMGNDDQSWPNNWSLLLSMLVVTIGGIFLVSSLIGIITTTMDRYLEKMRKGRSRVIESGHTIILGWSEQVFTIISELCIANENQPKSCIAILADKDKVEMEDEIKHKVGKTGRTRIVCRSGSPIDMDDLNIVSVQTSKSIIVLSSETDDSDSNVIKAILAIANHPERRSEPYHIVAEIRHPRNMEVARMVGKEEVELVLVGDLIARIIAQTCRQSGLSVVYTELLDFEGDEIYFQNELSMVGKTFADTLMIYEDSSVIGIVTKDGITQLNPPMDTVLCEGDQLMVIAEDDDTTHLSDINDYHINRQAVVENPPDEKKPESILILGWNWRAPRIISELDAYVAPGSIVTVVADYPSGEQDILDHCYSFQNITLRYKQGDTTDRRVIDSLSVPTYDHVILLCYSDVQEPQQADAQTLISLLHLRDIANKSEQPFSIVSEMLDIRNRNLAEVTRADDFIVSDRLVSLMLSQISENKYLNAVFVDIFDPEGSEIYLKPAANYVKLGEAVNFYTVIESARLKGEVAIGYKLKRYIGNIGKAYGVVVNPDKSDLVTFSEGDKIVVVAED